MSKRLKYLLDPRLNTSEESYLLDLMQSWMYEEVYQVFDVFDANCLLCLYDPKLFTNRMSLRKAGYKVLEYFRDNNSFLNAINYLRPTEPFKASRFSDGSHIEVTTKGDARFSPFFMRFKDGTTIENKYQLDIKGYRSLGAKSWKDVKGLPPINTDIDSEQEYTKLYLEYFTQNPCMLYELAVLGTFNTFTDLHWVEPHGSQAATYRDILNNLFKLI